MSRNAPSAPPNYQFMGGTPQGAAAVNQAAAQQYGNQMQGMAQQMQGMAQQPQGGMLGGMQPQQAAPKPTPAPTPAPQAPAPQGAYPQAQAYRQYLQNPVQGGGAHMAYNQFVESRGGPSPGMQPSGAGMTGSQIGGPSAGAGGPPVGVEQWNAYKSLMMPTGKGFGNKGNAAMQYAQRYGGGYDPEGIIARTQALRAKSPFRR